MIRRLLIANRGEIAVRIVRTCRALGIETVAVYSDADRKALHVLEADQAVHIGGSPASESYLSIEAIIKAAKSAKADAVHPGYGLLSENPLLAEACAAAKLVFVGPSADVIRTMGDKAAARRIADENGVPTVPGYNGEKQDIEALAKQAKKIGYPVMIKAAAGGGGRGMRVVAKPDEFAEAAESAHREAERAFADGRLILEKAIVGGRHVEVQVLGDAHGNVVHLGERDCSVQRRHQKVIEESPSPAVDPALRRRMGDAALKIARAVGYTNAGTVECLLDADGSFYFLEMNTRLQVEHGVTELRTGLDLVALQIAVANGEALPFTQDKITFSGHAIECRVYAEEPARGYLPSAGRIEMLQLPGGDGVRIDSGTYAGDEISTYYDPMMAKVLTWGRVRAEAITRMEDALAGFRVEGVRTNLALLRDVVAHPAFKAGQATTDFLDREVSTAALGQSASDEALLAAFGYVMLHGDGRDPWRKVGPWRVGGRARVDLYFAGSVYVVEGQRTAGTADEWTVRLRDETHRVRYEPAADRVLVETGGTRRASRVVPTDTGLRVMSGEEMYAFEWSFGERHPAVADSHKAQGLTAPMPGLVLKVLVRPGEKVRVHQTLIVLEAMKMEHAIEAPHDGIVSQVHCAEGGRVSEGTLLAELEPEK